MKQSETQIILVPTDFSAHSVAALGFAAYIAFGTGQKILLLHVIHEPPEAPGYYREHTKIGDDRPFDAIAKDMMANFLQKTEKAYPALKKVCVEPVFLEGRPTGRILDYALLKKVEHIVMGTHNRKGASGWLIASKTKKIIKKAPMPVSVVKAPLSPEESSKG